MEGLNQLSGGLQAMQYTKSQAKASTFQPKPPFSRNKSITQGTKFTNQVSLCYRTVCQLELKVKSLPIQKDNATTLELVLYYKALITRQKYTTWPQDCHTKSCYTTWQFEKNPRVFVINLYFNYKAYPIIQVHKTDSARIQHRLYHSGLIYS